MILTTCAACAAPLAHTAPRCVRQGRSEDSEAILAVQTGIAYILSYLDRDEEALELERTIYRQRMASRGISNIQTIRAALNLGV